LGAILESSLHGVVGKRISHAVGSTCVVGPAADAELVHKMKLIVSALRLLLLVGIMVLTGNTGLI
jgi:hypothetical protein